jgi:hypothetical protein
MEIKIGDDEGIDQFLTSPSEIQVYQLGESEGRDFIKTPVRIVAQRARLAVKVVVYARTCAGVPARRTPLQVEIIVGPIQEQRILLDVAGRNTYTAVLRVMGPNIIVT